MNKHIAAAMAVAMAVFLTAACIGASAEDADAVGPFEFTVDFDGYSISFYATEQASEGVNGTAYIKKVTINEDSTNVDLVLPETVTRSDSGYEGFVYDVIGIGIENYGMVIFSTEDGADNIRSISMPDTYTWLAPQAFVYCSNLESVKLSAGLESIPEKTFSKITTIGTSSSGELYIDVIAPGTKIASIDIPEGIKTIGVGAFKDCPTLTHVSIPSTVNEIQREAFRNTGLTTVEIIIADPSIERSIGDSAFASNSNLVSINIPEGFTIIDVEAFQNCKSMTEVSIPGTMEQLYGDVFDGCTSLETVTFSGAQPPIIPGGTFGTNVEFIVPEGSEDMYQTVLDTATGGTASVNNYVAMVGDEKFNNIHTAIDSVESRGTVILLKNTTESVTIPSGKEITLDLGVSTLTNSANQHTISVESGATFTIQGTGTVDNTSNGCATLYNEGNVTMKSGTLTRSIDTIGCTWYTLYNDGVMTIDGGTVRSDGDESSLIVNGLNKTATMTINDGTFYKKAFNCFKNEENGTVTVNGGTFEGVGFALQNWNEATINDGVFNNIVSSVTYGSIPSSTMTIKGGTFNGNVNSWNLTYQGSAATNSPEITITDGVFHGMISMLEGEEGKATSTSDKSKASVTVSGGTFDNPPEIYMMDDNLIMNENPDGTYGVVESVTITFDLPDDTPDETVEIPKGSIITSDKIPVALEGYGYEWKVNGNEWDPTLTIWDDVKVTGELRIVDVTVTLTIESGYVKATVDSSVDIVTNQTTYQWMYYATIESVPEVSEGTDSCQLSDPGYYAVIVTVYDASGVHGIANAILTYRSPGSSGVSYDIEHDGDSATVAVPGDTVIITSSGEHDDIDITLGFTTADIEINGNVGSGAVTVTAKPMTEDRIESALTDLISEEIVTDDIRGVDITVSNVDDGYGMWIKVKMDGIIGDDNGEYVASAMAYYIDKDDIREPVDCYVQGEEVWIYTDHNTEYVVIPTGYSSEKVFEEIPSEEPDQPVTVPDDDELPPFIPAQPKDDDTVTIVACAAAAVVAALMAVFLMLTYRKD